jgi:hypothetical protein
MLNQRKTTMLILSIATLLLTIPFLSTRVTAAYADDDHDDVTGGSYVSKVGAEGYDVTCGDLPALTYLDIVTLIWYNTSVNYTMSIYFGGIIDMAKINAGEIWGGMQFSVNGSDIANYQIEVFFMDVVANWGVHVGMTGFYGIGANGSTFVTWSFAKSLLSTIPNLNTNLSQWTARAYVMWRSENTMQIAWDEYNYDTYAGVEMSITCVNPPPSVSGYEMMIVGLALIVSGIVMARIVAKRSRLFEK